MSFCAGPPTPLSLSIPPQQVNNTSFYFSIFSWSLFLCERENHEVLNSEFSKVACQCACVLKTQIAEGRNCLFICTSFKYFGF
jgi:hypothetical protein